MDGHWSCTQRVHVLGEKLDHGQSPARVQGPQDSHLLMLWSDLLNVKDPPAGALVSTFKIQLEFMFKESCIDISAIWGGAFLETFMNR